MTLFDLPIWDELKPYTHVTFYSDVIRLDFLRLPDELRARALLARANCVSCGSSIAPLRARALSDRSRITGTETEHRLFYGPTCPTEVNHGCSRTKEAKLHKEVMRTVPELYSLQQRSLGPGLKLFRVTAELDIFVIAHSIEDAESTLPAAIGTGEVPLLDLSARKVSRAQPARKGERPFVAPAVSDQEYEDLKGISIFEAIKKFNE